MKALGTILIIICLGVNVYIGTYLYKKAFVERPVGTVSETELLKLPPKEHIYEAYGFSFVTPGKFISQGAAPQSDVVDFLYFDKQYENAFDPNIPIYVLRNQKDGGLMLSAEYQKLSKTDLLDRNKELEPVYIDGGIMTNRNGIKFYYDTISLKHLNFNRRVTEKKYSFYVGNNLYDLVYQDSDENFAEGVKEFEEMIQTVKKI